MSTHSLSRHFSSFHSGGRSPMDDDLPEIARLFSRLLSDLQPSESPSDGLSSLLASLNPDAPAAAADDPPESRVLDAALSFMCFDSTAVLSGRIRRMLGTLVSALNGSVSCRGLCSGRAGLGFVRIGSSVSYRDCCEIVRLCAGAVRRLKGHCEEDILHALSCAILKLAVSTSPFEEGKDGEVKSDDAEMRSAISELKHSLAEVAYPIENEVPLRVGLWYLDPSSLKTEISEILNEAIHRPFICLRNEMYDRPAWQGLILSLISSPSIFMEIRSLLHFWFFETGIGSILELQNAIVCSILDVLLRPLRWGVQTEMGLNYPSTYTYFPEEKRELLAVLAGPISCARFLDLVSCINSEVGQEISAETVDYDSAWAMVINFPCWYYLASAILFHKDASEDCISKFIHGEILTESMDETKLICAACQYIAWNLCPIDKSKVTALAEDLSLSSKSWVRNAKTTSKRPSFIARTKKLSIRKNDEFEKPNLTTWIKEFERHSFDRNLMYSKIPLGILISSHTSMDQSEYELLLHYAATGEILDSRNTHTVFLRNNSTSKKKAVDGARFVLNFLDSIEELSMYIFESEDARLLYLSRLCRNSGVYSLRCVRFLLELPDFDKENMTDLYVRFVRWKNCGALHGFHEFENLLDSIRLKYCL